MAWQGNWQGKWNGNWHGPVEQNPGAMYANLSGSGAVTADICQIEEYVVTPSGGRNERKRDTKDDSVDYSFLRLIQRDARAEQIRLAEIEYEKARLEQEAVAVRQEVPKNGTEQDYQNRNYLALLTEQIAALDAENALLLAKLRAIEYEIEQRALEAESAALVEQDIVFCMAMLAAA